MDFSAFCRGLVAFTSPFVFQGGGALYTHYSHYKHMIECGKTRIPELRGWPWDFSRKQPGERLWADFSDWQSPCCGKDVVDGGRGLGDYWRTGGIYFKAEGVREENRHDVHSAVGNWGSLLSGIDLCQTCVRARH